MTDLQLHIKRTPYDQHEKNLLVERIITDGSFFSASVHNDVMDAYDELLAFSKLHNLDDMVVLSVDVRDIVDVVINRFNYDVDFDVGVILEYAAVLSGYSNNREVISSIEDLAVFMSEADGTYCKGEVLEAISLKIRELVKRAIGVNERARGVVAHENYLYYTGFMDHLFIGWTRPALFNGVYLGMFAYFPVTTRGATNGRM